MNKKEFVIFTDAMRTYYPKEKVLPNEQAMALWYDRLKDLDYQDAANALNRWADTEKWSPSIADIRSMVNKTTEQDAAPEWVDAWNEVTKAISKYGYCREQSALDSMSPITRACVKAIGWQNICNSEEIGVERGHFRSMYESKADSVKKTQAIQPALRTDGENNMLGKLLGDMSERLALE